MSNQNCIYTAQGEYTCRVSQSTLQQNNEQMDKNEMNQTQEDFRLSRAASTASDIAYYSQGGTYYPRAPSNRWVDPWIRLMRR